MSLPSIGRQQQQNDRLKSELPTSYQLMLAIVGINTMLISFLSLLTKDVVHLRHHGMEQAWRRASRRAYQRQAPQTDIAYKAPIATNIVKFNGSNMLELKCQDHPVWNNDQVWRNAVLRPVKCNTATSFRSLEEQLYQQEQLALLNETIMSNNADFTPCGAYCLYHLDSAYSYQYGHSLYGWTLSTHESKVTDVTSNTSSDSTSLRTECWLPFNSRSEDSACIKYYYNDWIGYVEDVEAKQRNLPMYEKRSDSDNHLNPESIQEQMSKFQPKCSESGDKSLESSDTSPTVPPYCHFRSYDGGSSRMARKLQDFDRSIIEFRKNLKPSEIVHLFDRYQLGIDDLSDALTLMTETFAHLNASSCNRNHRPTNLLLCVYHRQSITRRQAVSGQYGAKVPIVGWQYRTLDRCFIPYEDMEHSSACGRNSYQFNTWSRYMLERQQQIRQEQVQNETTRTKCDRMPLSFGRNVWDRNADEYAFLPPLPTKEPPLRGVQYSEQSVCGPRILIVGAMKCGTNSIGTLLSHHPRVKLNRCTEEKPKCDLEHFMAGKESVWEGHGLTHNFVQEPQNYIAKYAQKLPITEEYDYLQLPDNSSVVGRGSLTIDKSPSYFNTDIFPNIARRAKQILPNAKIVVSLCNPVERMYSEFHHTLLYSKDIFDLFFTNHNVPSPRNFTELVQYMKFSAEVCNDHPIFCDELRRDMLHTGIYHKSVRAWRNAFGTENVLVLNMEESNYDKMKKITALMGDYLPDNEFPWEMLSNVTKSFSNEFYGGRRLAFTQHQMAADWLHGFFYRSNVALAKEIDAEWPLRWNQKAQQ